MGKKRTDITHIVKILIHSIRDTHWVDVTIKKQGFDQHKFKIVTIFWGEWDFYKWAKACLGLWWWCWSKFLNLGGGFMLVIMIVY